MKRADLNLLKKVRLSLLYSTRLNVHSKDFSIIGEYLNSPNDFKTEIYFEKPFLTFQNRDQLLIENDIFFILIEEVYTSSIYKSSSSSSVYTEGYIVIPLCQIGGILKRLKEELDFYYPPTEYYNTELFAKIRLGYKKYIPDEFLKQEEDTVFIDV